MKKIVFIFSVLFLGIYFANIVYRNTQEEQAKHLADRWDKLSSSNNEKLLVVTLGIYLFRLRKWMRKRVWDEMFDHDLLVGQLSPFINGKVCLPTKDMLDIFIKNVNHLYITSFDILNKPKKRDNSLQKAIRAFNSTLKEIPFRKGIIENYIDLDIEKCTWKTNLHGKAFEIDNEFISAMR